MPNINFIATTIGTYTIFKGYGAAYGTSGSVWNSNGVGNFLFYLSDTAASKTNFTGNPAMLASASLVQTVYIDGTNPAYVYVFAPWREPGGENTVKMWVYADPGEFLADFRRTPGDNNQLPFINIATPTDEFQLAEFLAKTGSAACFDGAGQPMYPFVNWPL